MHESPDYQWYKCKEDPEKRPRQDKCGFHFDENEPLEPVKVCRIQYKIEPS